MKLALDMASANALYTLADQLPAAMASVAEETIKLTQVYQSVADSVGPHAQQFQQMLLSIRKAATDAGEAINTLPAGMRSCADKIVAYLGTSADDGTPPAEPQKVLRR